MSSVCQASGVIINGDREQSCQELSSSDLLPVTPEEVARVAFASFGAPRVVVDDSAPTPRVRSPKRSRQRMRAALVVTGGMRMGQIYRIGRHDNWIGRSPESDIVVADRAASWKHALIDWRDRRFVISDLGSTNGTTVNGKPAAYRSLADGDVIKIGGLELSFTTDPEVVNAARPDPEEEATMPRIGRVASPVRTVSQRPW